MASSDDRQAEISEPELITLPLGVSAEDKPTVEVNEEDSRVTNETSLASLSTIEPSSKVTIIVGDSTNNKTYTVPREVLSASSSFFSAACRQDTFLEGSSGTIKLPELDPEIFDIVLHWVQNAEYTLPDPFDWEAVLETYNATDFLGMTTLRTEIQKALTALVKIEVANPPGTSNISCNCIFLQLASASGMSDWMALRGMADLIYPARHIVGDSLRRQYVNGGGRDLALLVMVDSLQDALRTTMCSPCLRGGRLRKPRRRCILCSQPGPIPRRTIEPQFSEAKGSVV